MPRHGSDADRAIAILAVTAATAASVAGVLALKRKAQPIHETADGIEAALNALDPAARAAVIARLAIHEKDRIAAQRA
ncbi:hypothetical protein [Branchiibius sp. NY16-3462-2]|uniref:hypothetical protein n=1 Tax=Branchiibius sp. NY16-3462-2 TaxID=1807500 RepID=UPI0007926430|nr:hypothetical protein [Branchiibius sp. NY16-3462-2]KYH45623.1 hypothetical protein AZH51_18050 [Branchiibius sp. NY16-3462-2]